jgi:hypothetical protein
MRSPDILHFDRIDKFRAHAAFMADARDYHDRSRIMRDVAAIARGTVPGFVDRDHAPPTPAVPQGRVLSATAQAQRDRLDPKSDYNRRLAQARRDHADPNSDFGRRLAQAKRDRDNPDSDYGRRLAQAARDLADPNSEASRRQIQRLKKQLVRQSQASSEAARITQQTSDIDTELRQQAKRADAISAQKTGSPTQPEPRPFQPPVKPMFTIPAQHNFVPPRNRPHAAASPIPKPGFPKMNAGVKTALGLAVAAAATVVGVDGYLAFRNIA